MIAIILYLGGNFPLLSSPEREKEFIKKVENYGCQYNRLITFYHKEEALVAINLQKKPILRKRKKRNEE